jgi:hypothetical protein
LPYAGLKFYVYQTMKNHYRTRLITADKQQQQLLQQQQQQQGQSAPTVQAPQPQPPLQKQEQQHTEQHQLPPPPPFETAVEQAQAAEEEQEEQQRPQKLPVAVTLVFGGVAGLVAQTVTYPLVSLQHVHAQTLKIMPCVELLCPGNCFACTHAVIVGCSMACGGSAA